jgi:hypothetical protein
MPGEISVEVKRIAEVQQMLDAAPKNLVALGFLKALEAGIKVFYDELDLKTPIRLGFDTGDLVVEGGDLKAALTTIVKLDSQLRGGIAGATYGNLSYLVNWLEYGHRMIGHKPDKKQLHGPRTPQGEVKPFPWVRDVFDRKADEAVDAFANSLIATIKAGL